MRERNEKDFLLRNSLGDLDFSSSDSSERQAERTIAKVTRDYNRKLYGIPKSQRT